MLELKKLRQSILSRFVEPFNFIKIAVAVSGGCDSVALLDLMKNYCKMKNKEICIFHINHNLRSESSSELQWVESLAKTHNIEFHYKVLSPPTEEILKVQGTEAWAREERYIAFSELNTIAKADVITTAHTANDQAETVLMRLMRGTSLEGFTGIKKTKVLNFTGKENFYWRPLLNVYRLELERYLALSNQDWVEDKSNSNLDFFRNKLRNEVIPYLEKIMPNTVQHLVSISSDVSEFQQWFSKHIAKKTIEAMKNGYLEINEELDIYELREMIKQWLIIEGFDNKITRKLLSELCRLLNGDNGKKIIINKREIVKVKNGLKIN